MIAFIIGIAIGLIFVFLGIFLPYECPKCGGKLKKIYFDAELDKEVYECERCHRQYC